MSDELKGFITNERDRDNLNFLLSVSRKTLIDWFAKAEADDLKYADELLRAYSKELDYEDDQDKLESKLMAMDDYDEALAVIERCK